MAVDAAASRTDRARSNPFARLAAVPAWLWVAGIVTASCLGRLIAAAGRPVPHYLPDEYIYPSLARSLAEHGRNVGECHRRPKWGLRQPVTTGTDALGHCKSAK